MPSLNETRISCGVVQLSGLYGTSALGQKQVHQRCLALVSEEFSLADHNYDESFCHVIFSDTAQGPGSDLAEFIRKQRLGPVRASVTRTNPNTDHDIIVWVWSPDFDKLEQYVEEHG